MVSFQIEDNREPPSLYFAEELFYFSKAANCNSYFAHLRHIVILRTWEGLMTLC